MVKTMSVQPISPGQVRAAPKPYEVIQVFNELIQKHWDGDRAVVKQDDAVGMIMERMDISHSEMIEARYLDVEEVYREAGWKVHYDKPGYNENPYPRTFTFRKPDGR
jgi:hypothetical protein